MIIKNKQVELRILKAEDGKIIVSKEKVQVDEKGTMDYAIKAKEIYLGVNDSEENYIEIEEVSD
nr:MAG TPA: hypothetical protein [Caudoviricetes sp.]